MFVVGVNRVAIAVQQRAPTTPIVAVFLSDPVRSGVVKTLARPGGNITGLSWDADPEIMGKNVQLLVELLPGASRVAGVWNPQDMSVVPYIPPLKNAAARLGVVLVEATATRAADIENTLIQAKREGAAGIVVAPDALLYAERRRVSEIALRLQLPSVWGFREAVEAGGVLLLGWAVRLGA